MSNRYNYILFSIKNDNNTSILIYEEIKKKNNITFRESTTFNIL